MSFAQWIKELLLREKNDVAFSFNGSDLGEDSVDSYVTPIVNQLQSRGLKLFYYRDEDTAQKTLGNNLSARLPQIYQEESRLVLLVASPEYGIQGHTESEWRAIRERQSTQPEDNFLLCVSHYPASQLAEEVGNRVFIDPANHVKDWPKPVVAEVLRRLGRGPLIRVVTYLVILLLALAGLVWTWAVTTYLSEVSTVATIVSVFFGVAWTVWFLLLPRLFPELVSSPKHLFQRLMQRTFTNGAFRRITFLIFLFCSMLAVLSIPSKQNQMISASNDWFAGNDNEKSQAIRFFKSGIPKQDGIAYWTDTIIDTESFDGSQRGQALDILFRLISSPDNQEQVDFPSLIRNRFVGQDPNIDNWPLALTDIRANDIQINNVNFDRMHIIGKETTFENSDFSSCSFRSSYWQNTRVEKSDFRWSPFTLSAFIGLKGNADFSHTKLTELTVFGSQLGKSSFYGADLTGASFISCDLKGCDFTNAHLAGATFEDCDLTNAKFTDEDVQWEGVWGKLAGVSFIDSRMGGIKISGAQLNDDFLAIFRALAPDPNKMDGETQVYSRDKTSLGADLEAPANIAIPPALIIRCEFNDYQCNDGSRFDGETDFSKTETSGLQIDQSSWNSLKQREKVEIQGGGFEIKSLLTEYEHSSENTVWDKIKSQMLVPLFQAFDEEN